MTGALNQKGLKIARRCCLKFLSGAVLLLLAAAMVSKAAPVTLDSPLGFFTNVASRFLSAELNLNLNQIQVYPTNQYTPAVQRLLQVSANLYDATTTNFYPAVFRPMFSVDAVAGSVLITGYQQVTNVTGLNDPQLALPVDAAFLAATNVSLTNLPVNVYGVPWIIGVKQGFPTFNKLSMETVVQIWRKLEIHNPTPGNQATIDATNMMWVFSITNSIGVDCWNSYDTAYTSSNNFTILVQDNLSMALALTNGIVLQTFNSVLPSVPFLLFPPPLTWPGSTWLPASGGAEALNPSAPSPFIIPLYTNIAFLPTSYYQYYPQQFVRQTDPSIGFQNVPVATSLPQMVLLTTNHLQFVMLDGSNVIDYVQFSGPNNVRNLNAMFQTTNTTVGYGNWWSTAIVGNGAFKGVPAGIASQITTSESPIPAGDQGYWGNLTIAEEQIDGFAMYMGFAVPYPQASIKNSSIAQSYLTSTMVQVPYTPMVTIVDYTSWQANDPLVHYLTSDLYFSGTETSSSGVQTGVNIWPGNNALPLLPDIGQLSQRFAPWGDIGRATANNFSVDQNAYNLAYKDPGLLGPDHWSFPTGQPLDFGWIGRVHRGTPWQTLYLKDTNIIQLVDFSNPNPATGLATWQFWTGDSDPNDAIAMAPVQDWQLASLLASMFNTNDLRSLLSVNNPDPNAWQSLFDGLTAWTNDDSGNFSTITISSNSVQASVLASAIESARASQPGQMFGDVGTILSVPELTTASPWLNPFGSTMSDEQYEAVASQLLPLLRLDSIGSVTAPNGETLVQFTGYDDHAYAIESSSDLVHWTAIATNSPSNGSFTFPVAPASNGGQQFYRTVLLY